MKSSPRPQSLVRGLVQKDKAAEDGNLEDLPGTSASCCALERALVKRSKFRAAGPEGCVHGCRPLCSTLNGGSPKIYATPQYLQLLNVNLFGERVFADIQ